MMSPLRALLGPWARVKGSPEDGRCELVETLLVQPQHVQSSAGDGADLLIVHSQWRSHAGQRLGYRLSAPLDGRPQALPDYSGATFAARLEDGALLTILREPGGACQQISRRVLPDGQLMVQVDADAPQPWSRAGVKQVLVYRRDLKMRKGKIAAQCAHAALSVFLHRDGGSADRLDVPMNGPMAWWLRHSMAKIVLSVDDESALLRVHELARDDGLPTVVITDAGRTEFHGQPTRTVVAVGPALSTEIDEITGPQGQVQTRLA